MLPSLLKTSQRASTQLNIQTSDLICDLNGIINSTAEIETNTHPEQSTIPITQNKPEQQLPLPSNKALDPLKIRSKKGTLTAGKFDSLFAGKSAEIKKQEIGAVAKFKAALSQDIPIQKELSELSIQQLNVLLPYTYVEASHPISPVMAYNTPDLYRKRETTLDDNVAMLQAYGAFLSDINVLLTAESDKETKITSLIKAIKKVFGILLYGNESNENYIREEHCSAFRCNALAIYKGEELYNKITAKKKSVSTVFSHFSIECFNTNIEIEIDNCYIKGTHFIFYNEFYTEKIKTNIIRQLAESLLKSYKINDLSRIFKITSDFMYCHILYNANGRASQIFRDCFALMLNQPPFTALTPISHYMYLDSEVDKEHMIFMQTIFLNRLDEIKKGNDNFLIDESQINTLITKHKGNLAIVTDLDFLNFKLNDLRQSRRLIKVTPSKG